MKITEGNINYYARVLDDGTITSALASYATILPQGYDRAKLYPVKLLIHGKGERGQDKYADLKNVVMGFDYDESGPLPRQFAIATDDYKQAINLYGFIGVVVTYAVNTDFKPEQIDWVLDQVEAEYAVDRTREALVGFSLGGGAVIRYVTSSAARAKRLVLAVACAPVNWATNEQFIVDAKLQVIGTTNRTDDVVDPSNVKKIIADINTLNPAIFADLIIFPQDGHGSFKEMLMISHPSVPQNMYEYVKSININSRLPYPTSVTQPIPPIVTPPATTVNPITSYAITGTKIALVGSKSTGYTQGYDGTWEFKSGPAGVTAKQVFPNGSSYIDANGILPVQGTYVFQFNLKGANPTSVTVVYGNTVPEKTAVSYTNKTVTFSDGSTEAATAVITTASGKTYNL